MLLIYVYFLYWFVVGKWGLRKKMFDIDYILVFRFRCVYSFVYVYEWFVIVKYFINLYIFLDGV